MGINPTMVHFNGNILCAIDTETTGLDFSKQDMIQIAIVPLNANCQPLKELNGNKIYPFYHNLKPRFPENVDRQAMSVNGLDLDELSRKGLGYFEAAEMFEEWFARLGIAEGKKILPLGHNYAFDKNWIADWLGPEHYNHYFHYHHRDSMVAALYANDRAVFRHEMAPFPKVNLQYIAQILGVQTARGHDALSDCLTTAEVYRRLLQLQLVI